MATRQHRRCSKYSVDMPSDTSSKACSQRKMSPIPKKRFGRQRTSSYFGLSPRKSDKENDEILPSSLSTCDFSFDPARLSFSSDEDWSCTKRGSTKNADFIALRDKAHSDQSTIVEQSGVESPVKQSSGKSTSVDRSPVKQSSEKSTAEKSASVMRSVETSTSDQSASVLRSVLGDVAFSCGAPEHMSLLSQNYGLSPEKMSAVLRRILHGLLTSDAIVSTIEAQMRGEG